MKKLKNLLIILQNDYFNRGQCQNAKKFHKGGAARVTDIASLFDNLYAGLSAERYVMNPPGFSGIKNFAGMGITVPAGTQLLFTADVEMNRFVSCFDGIINRGTVLYTYNFVGYCNGTPKVYEVEPRGFIRKDPLHCYAIHRNRQLSLKLPVNE